MKSPGLILCPVDFSPPSREALRYAADLTRHLGAELLVLHVLDLPVFAADDPLVASHSRLVDEYERVMTHRLDECVAEVRSLGVPAKAHVSRGVVHAAVCDAARDLGADLVVLGTHGRTGVTHALLGSVAERVVRTCPVPVLTFRAAG